MPRLARWLIAIIGLVGAVMIAWALAIGPVAMWRVLTHGTTTVWDHLEYPGRTLAASPDPDLWPTARQQWTPPEVAVEGYRLPLAALLTERATLSFVVIREGELAYEWYAPGHGPETRSMLFSVTKSVLSLLIGAAIDDGLIGSVTDTVTDYVPELAAGGFDQVTLEDLLHMNSNSTYVENDNPFGIHVEFNYTDDLESDILSLRIKDEADPMFRYKSGDYAVLGLVLDRVLGGQSITEYFQERMWDPVGAEFGGVWSTDADEGLERTWCCLATTARDLARLGHLVVTGGLWGDTHVIPAGWLDASFRPAYEPARWPAEFQDSPLVNYGYGWWLTADAVVAVGKDGQYLYVDPARRVAVARLGAGQGGIGWVDVLRQVAAAG